MYDEYYGLTGRPFQLTPDPTFYFESATHRKALSYLGYGLAQGEGFIVITGDVGTGKSTLVSHLMQSIDRARMTAATIVTSQRDAYDLIQMAAETFGIDTRGLDKAASLKSIENFLHAEARLGRRCLLVVDEAQNLSVQALEELRMLSNFQLGSTALLQIFLLGQPEFRDLVLQSPELEQLRQRIIATHHLEPMFAREVEPYVTHRLTRAGWTGNPAFAPETFPALYEETGGVPRRLNTLMNRVMLMGAVEHLNFFDPSTIQMVVADMAGKPFAAEAQMCEGAGTQTETPLIEVRPEDFKIEEADVDHDSGELRSLIEGGAAHQSPETVVAETTLLLEPVMEDSAQELSSAVPEPLTLRSEKPEADVTSEGSNYVLEMLTMRLAALEMRVSEQDDALRRVLSTMIDWMDKEGSPEARFRMNNRAA